MGHEALISVIVITYNARHTILRCLDSILTQSFRDFELIVVDDGSTDGSDGIMDRYAESDNRIRIVHQENGGIAKARQTGLDSAEGVFTLFVDSDDWIESDMLESMYDNALQESSDMVFCDFMEEADSGSFYRKQEPVSHDSIEVLAQLYVNLHGSLWNKLIRNDLYRKNRVRFIPGLNYREDECILIRLLRSGCRISYVNKALYHYDRTMNTNSATSHRFRPIEEYELYIKSCAPYFNTPELQTIFNYRISYFIDRLTFAPSDKYNECRAFYQRHKALLQKCYRNTEEVFRYMGKCG